MRSVGRPHPRLLALVPVLVLSAVLNTNRLSKNGYANTFYSAAVKSMLRSFHNFLFVSFDPGGLVTVDKPPIALWVQTLSAKLFGFSPLSLLLPEAIAGVLSVALLYHLLTRRIGPLGALAGALALAVFPSFVAVSRENGVDPVLILLLVLACAVGLRAVETGRWRTLLLCGAVVGLAFNTKTLAAYLVVPGIALAYIVCAPGSIWRRALQLLAAGVVMLVVSFAWIFYVDSVPASQRPYVGSSTNNSEMGLTFGYNGLGRVEGQVGGPGNIPIKPGALAHISLPPPPKHRPQAHPRTPAPKPSPAKHPSGRVRSTNPIPFGGPVGPLRLFGVGLGDQGGWFLPFALFGLIALGLLGLRARNRHDRKLAVTLMLGGWFLTEAAVLSLSKGIVHPYYISGLAPGSGAMVGAGVAAFVEMSRRRDWRLALALLAVAATVLVEVKLLHREHYMEWFIPVLLAGTGIGLLALLALRRLAVPATALTLLLLLAAPGAYASTTWEAPVEGTFPAAGPTEAAGAGGVGVSGPHLGTYLSIIAYVRAHHPGTRWAVLTDAAETAAPFILLDVPAGAMAGYSGTDPALDGPQLARYVARREARYVVLGGEFSSRGGNKATAAVLRACYQLPPSAWHDLNIAFEGLVLFDCAGHERQLAAE